MSSTDRLRLSAALAALLAASACAHAPPTNGRVAKALTPLEQYPVHAVEQPQEVALSVHPGGALSPAQDAAIAAFAQTWRSAGGGVGVSVQAPSGVGVDARSTARHVADRLAELGVPATALTVVDYDAGPSAGAPVIARYTALTASAPDCSKGWDNLVATNDNNVSTHFGCANARNFAVMLADPHDLQGPRPITPADAGRRAVVLDKYRQGAVTASAKDDQASGAVSQRVR